MKKLLSVLVCALMVFSLFGCSSEGSEEKSITVFLPGEYIDEDMVRDFEAESGIKVSLDTFDSNETMYTSLAGGSEYDMVIPSDYMIEKLIDEDMLQPLDLDLITNYGDLYEGVLNMDYDPDNTYSIPYFWGNVGIVYDATMIDPADVEAQGWEVLRNTKYAGMSYLYDSVRDEFMIAEKALGYSMNTENEEEIKAAAEWLSELVKTMDASIATDETIDGLAFQEGKNPKYMSIMYSGDAAYILSENENMRFSVPSQGTNYWVDAMCVLKTSEKMDLCCEFMDFLISYDGSLANSSCVGYSAVNKEALEELAETDFEGNNAYLPKEKTALDESFHNNEKTRAMLGDLWLKAKNAKNN